MRRTYIKDLVDQTGQKVKINGWVSVRRNHGKLLFLDVRDHTASVQVVFKTSDNDDLPSAEAIRAEFIVEIEGIVKERPDKLVNPSMATGKIEMAAEKLTIISKAQTPPFEIEDEHHQAGEEVRMQYRYLDLRSKRMQDIMHFRHKFIRQVRDYLDEEGFVEIETPILTKSSPEGSRDFLVPSRLSPGNFYALPQAPQQFKQLLMIAGFERYYQIARCFRDEDLRLDRQPEFSQLDIEMSFVSQEEILDLTEKMLKSIIKRLCPEKKLPTKFPQLTYDEVMTKYKTDKPDLRKNKKDDDELAFAWIVDFPMFERNSEGDITFAHNPFARPRDEDLKWLDSSDPEDLLKVRAYSYDLVLNGFELSSGGLRIHDPKLQTKIFRLMGLTDQEIEDRFGNFLKAFVYGTPPHGGLAPGLDRIIMLLLKTNSIRDVVAFPKTGDMRDLMLDSPSATNPDQLKELGININRPPKK